MDFFANSMAAQGNVQSQLQLMSKQQPQQRRTKINILAISIKETTTFPMEKYTHRSQETGKIIYNPNNRLEHHI